MYYSELSSNQLRLPIGLRGKKWSSWNFLGGTQAGLGRSANPAADFAQSQNVKAPVAAAC